MKIDIEELSFQTKGRGDIIDITRQVEEIVKNSKIQNGLVNIFVRFNCRHNHNGIRTWIKKRPQHTF